MFHRIVAAVAAAALAASLGGCFSIAEITTVQNAPDEAPVMYGPKVHRNATPLDGALACLGEKLQAKRQRLAVGIGDIKDYTGKFSQLEGAAITQGGSLMLYSALGKLGRSVRLHERFDTRIGEAELAFIDRRQLGNGRANAVDGPPGPNGEAPRPVPWVPYYGGSVLESQYYIVGGITEVNYNIQSGGAELSVSNIGPRGRVYTMNIAVDLRLVDTRSLVVVKTANFQKQITGYEVGAGIFRFFGVELFDVNVGAKNQEPIQLGVRTTLEYAVLDLIGSVARVDYRPCLSAALLGDIGPPVYADRPPPQVRIPPPPVQALASGAPGAPGVPAPPPVAAAPPLQQQPPRVAAGPTISISPPQPSGQPAPPASLSAMQSNNGMIPSGAPLIGAGGFRPM